MWFPSLFVKKTTVTKFDSFLKLLMMAGVASARQITTNLGVPVNDHQNPKTIGKSAC